MSDHAKNPDLNGWIAADEVQEPKALQEEINKLREENRALRERMEILQSAANRQSDSSTDEELYKVLKAIEVKIPSALTNGKDVTLDLLNIAYSNRDMLINGVTNGYGASEGETFFYFNIIPKLQAHGLADNEKVAGVRYRRGFLNKRGQQFFAALERKHLLSKPASQKSSDAKEPKPAESAPSNNQPSTNNNKQKKKAAKSS